MNKKLLSIKDVAEQYSIKLRTLRDMCLTGRLRASKIGKGWYVRPEHIDKLIEEGCNVR
jgi:excisionase family DNA binding protein